MLKFVITEYDWIHFRNRFLYSGERWGTVIKHDIETKQSIYVANENNNRGDVYHMDQHVRFYFKLIKGGDFAF